MMPSAAEKISITMTPDMARAVRESVEAADYASMDEALQDALRVWRLTRDERIDRLDLIRGRLRRSVDDPRPSLSADDVRQSLDALHSETVKSAVREAL